MGSAISWWVVTKSSFNEVQWLPTRQSENFKSIKMISQQSQDETKENSILTSMDSSTFCRNDDVSESLFINIDEFSNDKCKFDNFWFMSFNVYYYWTYI